jgi:hypothetical protein
MKQRVNHPTLDKLSHISTDFENTKGETQHFPIMGLTL